MLKRNLKLMPMLAVLLALAACSSWERTTYRALSASKAVIDEAALDYNAGVLPKTAAVKAVVEKAQAAQRAAVTAFEAYAVSKAINDPARTLEQKRAAVIAATAEVASLVAQIKSLYGGR